MNDFDREWKANLASVKKSFSGEEVRVIKHTARKFWFGGVKASATEQEALAEKLEASKKKLKAANAKIKKLESSDE